MLALMSSRPKLDGTATIVAELFGIATNCAIHLPEIGKIALQNNGRL